jgi:hypothetical protein
MLEAAGFRAYRRILRGNEVCGANLVHDNADLYLDVRLVEDGVWADLSGEPVGANGGLFVNFDDLHHRLPGLLADALEQLQALKALCGRFEADRERRVAARLDELQAVAGRGLEACWLGGRGFTKGLYRGVILEIDDQLRVLDVEDERVRPACVLSETAPPLREVLDRIDAAGGYEEEQIEALEEPALSEDRVAVP